MLLRPSPQIDSFNNAVRRIDIATRAVTTVAGNYALSNFGVTGPPLNFGHDDGVGTAASFYFPSGVSMDAAGTFAFVVSGERGGLSGARQRVKPRRPPHPPPPTPFRLMATTTSCAKSTSRPGL